jgi:hypothetical protein
MVKKAMSDEQDEVDRILALDAQPLTQEEKTAICQRLQEQGLIEQDESDPDASLITPDGMAKLLQQLHRTN